MKARIIGTGEIIDLKGTSIEFGTATWIDSNNIFHQGNLPNGGVELLEKEEPNNWQQVRINAAIAAMQGNFSNSDDRIEPITNIDPSSIAKFSVRCADALIEELKRK